MFYQRDDEKRWRGPGKVIGQIGTKVLIKIPEFPTGLITVHSCRVILTSEAEKQKLLSVEEELDSSSQTDDRESTKEDHYDISTSGNKERDKGLEVQIVHREDISGPEDVNEEPDPVAGQNNIEAEVNMNDNDEPLTDASHESLDGDGEISTEVHTDVFDEPQDVEENHEVPTDKIYKSADLVHTRDLPKVNQTVKFRENDSDDWKRAKILGRGGKANGPFRYCLNIMNLDDNSKRCLDWKQNVSEWKNNTENVYTVAINKGNYENEKQKELENWKTLEVYDEVKDEGQDFVSVKWVFKEKEVDGKPVKKARLVARGFEENADTPTDSPTCAKDNIRLAISLIASMQWRIKSLDIHAAFLRGKDLDRSIHLKPPKEAQCTGKLWKLKRCVYGLNDASRFWYFRVREELSRLGCKHTKLDQSLFFYYTNKLEGILISHVDDFMYAGTQDFQVNVINNLKQTFKISKENDENFTYVGIEVQQGKEGIYVSQSEYQSKLQEIEIESSRRADKNSTITKEEDEKLGSVIGQLSWLATETRPDLAYDVCELSTSRKTGTVELLLRCNKIIKKAKYNTVFLYYPKLDLDTLAVRCYADASYGNLSDGGSQGGMFIELVSDTGSAPIEWQSKRLKRTPKSTLAAETIAMVDGIEAAYYTSTLLSEIVYNQKKSVPVEAFTDNYSLFEAAHSTTQIQDRRLRIEMSILREGISRNEYKLKWVKTSNQLADCFTKKGSDPSILLEHVTGKSITM